jgi:lysozyme
MKTELLDLIKEDLIRHEGYKEEIYLCSEGIPTFGIGHAVKETDMEYTWPVGSPVEKERIDAVFILDCEDAVNDIEHLISDVSSHSDQCIRVLVNMAFNLGRTRLSGFKNMLAAVEAKDYEKASEEMKDSRWYEQVGRRSVELVEMMRTA